MENIAPNNLVVRCYGYKIGGGPCVGVCLNFNLAAQAETPEKLREKMHEMIVSYIETVIETDDKASIPPLLCRRAPFKDWLIYYFIKVAIYLSHLPNKFAFIFKEAVPFHLAYNC